MRPNGKELENAVEGIERLIFEENTALKEADVKLEKRKLIISNGTKHEIDIHAEIDLGGGYKSVFIFECKDWNKPVGKNEIIVFIEKIRIATAQKGYFMAKNFTKDAIAQAKNEKRLQLINVDTDFIINQFPAVRVNSTHLNNVIIQVNTNDQTFKDRRFLDTEAAIIHHDGKKTPLKDYFLPILRPLEMEKIKSEQIDNLSIGEYPYTYTKELDFSGKGIYADDFELEKIKVTIGFDLRISDAKILSKFDIKTRGRYISFEPIETIDGNLIVSYTEIDSVNKLTQ